MGSRSSYSPAAEKTNQAATDYDSDPRWRSKPLTPAQVIVHDIRLETWRRRGGPLLETVERPVSSLVPHHAAATPSDGLVRASEAAKNPIEEQKFLNLEEEYGWARNLRMLKYQVNEHDSKESAKCRWIHVYSKFQEYLRGFLWALSDDAQTISETLHVLESTVQQQTRFSKHGKYFSPFSQVLRSTLDTHSMYPMLMAVPFLDWSVLDKTPPLRFQVDRREGFRSARSSVHMLRSVLQYFYRLEETADRESSQVFAKHKPWSTDRELDLKVRQWYGHYPTALNVDELWVLVMDPSHIVTFSSNQTWKSRSPPLQLTSRITDIAFRGIRNAYFTSQQNDGYTAMTHAIVSLSGAIGMMHKSFWLDLTLPSIDRYAGHLSHLQYRLHRSPSTKLVMDLIAFQDEISIVIQVTQRQVEMVSALQKQVNEAIDKNDVEARPSDRQAASTERNESLLNAAHARATYRQLSSSSVADPIVQLLENLLRELTDLQELRDNCDRLVTRTIQLVNIRLEDHGKAILVFTVVTIVFLPLNFVSSFFGMNFRDIRNMQQTQWLFWAVALCVTAGVLGISIFLAFSGGTIMENLLAYRDKRRELQLSSSTVSRQARYRSEEQGFRVLGTTGQTDGMNLMAGPAG